MPSRFWLLLEIDSSFVDDAAGSGSGSSDHTQDVLIDVIATAHHHHGQVI